MCPMMPVVTETVSVNGTYSQATSTWKQLTLDSLEGFQVLHTQQWLGQLSEKELQQAGCVMLLDTLPVEGSFIKLRF